VKRIQATLIAGLLLLILILPQLALAAGPEISNVQVPNITFATATITWTTNTTSDSQVSYGTNRPKDGTWQSVYDPDGVTHHSILLEGLDSDEIYYFEVESTDGSGTATDNNGGEYYSFKTLAWYSITLDSACGVCGDLWEPEVCNEVIGVTAVVAAEGDYRICWDSRTAANVPYGGTFTASAAGTYTLTFRMPEAKRGIHKVYLTNSFYDNLGPSAVAEFEVQPSVKIDPEEGPVGTEVTLYGYGFNANQAFQIKFKDTVITKATDKADGKGSWTLSYTIPETTGGSHAFNVGPKSDPDEVWVIKYFKVTPKITAPSSGTVGHTIEVKGTGFQSEERDIEVIFRSQSTDIEVVVMEAIVANEDGSWTAEIVVPPLKRGAYIIDASGESTRARDVTDIKDFDVVAGISVDPNFAYVGDTITVTGGGFATEETDIKITFAGTVVKSGITATKDGTWEASFVLPVSTFGSHTVEASGVRTPAVTTTLDTKVQILEFSPTEGAPGDSVSLTGNGFHGSQDLTVTIGGVTASGDVRTQSNGNVNVSFQVSKGSPVGKQTLVVTDEGGATDQVDFTVTKKTLSTTPLPVSPKDNTLRSGEATFHWQGATGSTSYTYTLEINTSAGSGNIWSKSGIAESSYTLTEEETLPKGTYYWRVKVVDDYGNEGAWSDYSSFKVSPIPTWVWVVVGLVVLVVLMVVAYRETKFKVTE
jgi:hypothetical protein